MIETLEKVDIPTLDFETWLPLFPGFYNTELDGDYSLDNEIYSINEERSEDMGVISYDHVNVDWEGYREEICKLSCDVVERYLSDIGIDVKVRFQKLYSPREYNFKTDSIDVEVIFSEESFKIFGEKLIENTSELRKYLKAKYTSYSGFISSYSNDADDWFEDTSGFTDNMDGHRLGALLEFLLVTLHDMDYLCDDVLEKVDICEYIINYEELRYSHICRECGEFIEASLKEDYSSRLKFDSERYKDLCGRKPSKQLTYEEWVKKQDINLTFCRYCVED